MKIRRYCKEDKDSVWYLHNIAMKATNGAHAEHPSLYDDLDNINETYLQSDGEFLVGIDNNQIVAMGALTKSSSNTAEIKRMRVLPEFQRRGFGLAILQTLEKRAIELGYTTVNLDTTVKQKGAQEFYIQNGYVEIGRSKVCNFDIIIFEKSLAK